MRLNSDASKISKDICLHMARHVAGLDIHAAGVDTDSWIRLLIHWLVRSNVMSYLQS